MRVLLVDDQPLNLELLKALCRAVKVDAETANDGFDAVEKASNEDFAFVIMDVHMPRMDGIEATRRIKEKLAAANRSTKVIGLTADKSEETMLQCLDAGMIRVVFKPIDMKTFVDIMELKLS